MEKDSTLSYISWQQREQLDGFSWDAWEDRIKLMHSMCNKEYSSVLDLGAGSMFLKKILNESVKYYPVDYVSRNDQTIVCDFNKYEFPDVKADVVFISGCMEFVDDIDWFLGQVAMSTNKYIVCSYCSVDYISDISVRRSYSWVNDLKTIDLIKKIQELGFIMTEYNRSFCEWRPMMRFERKSVDLLGEYSFCTGCGACKSICPQDAISMGFDKNGFIKPSIDKEKCVSCQKCLITCPSLNPEYQNDTNPSCYAVMAKDEIRRDSSSGGVFPSLASNVIKQNGAVFGAVWTDDFYVKHIGVTKFKDLARLRHSKYVQSSTENTYREVKMYLEMSKPVLYSGCPCQIAGLKKYLGREYENLVTVDLLCNYTPSIQVFRQYLDENYGLQKIKSYTSRVKDRGWDHTTTEVLLKSGKKYIVTEACDYFQLGFHWRLFMSDTCENCFFAEFPRQGDISLGDFHYINKYKAELDDRKGTSAVLLNTEKGRCVFEEISKEFIKKEETPIELLNTNRINLSAKHHVNRDNFYELIKSKSFNETVVNCLNIKLSDNNITNSYKLKQNSNSLEEKLSTFFRKLLLLFKTL